MPLFQPHPQDLELYVNLYKDAFGVKPRGERFAFGWPDEASFNTDLDGLVSMIEAEADRERSDAEAEEAAYRDAMADRPVTAKFADFLADADMSELRKMVGEA